jgi:hypothetical protein
MPEPSSRASFKPDYGDHLRLSGYSGVDMDFHAVPTDHITFVDEETMSVTGNTVVAGTEYAATFDIPMSMFEDYFANAPDSMIHVLTRGLESGHDFPVTVVFPEPYRVGLRAQLGEPTAGVFEEFVPFLVSEILPLPTP